MKIIILSSEALENLRVKKANAKQKQWMKNLAEFAESNLWTIYGEKYRDSPYQLHHVLGRSAKHNKVEIGHWFVIPVPSELHDVMSNHPLNVTHHKHKFTDEYGKQAFIFEQVLEIMCGQEFEPIPPIDVQMAIQGTGA